MLPYTAELHESVFFRWGARWRTFVRLASCSFRPSESAATSPVLTLSRKVDVPEMKFPLTIEERIIRPLHKAAGKSTVKAVAAKHNLSEACGRSKRRTAD